MLYDLIFSNGRDRFRDVEPVINHMLQNQEALQLNRHRVAFLEALRARFAQTRAGLARTADDFIGQPDTESQREMRLTRWEAHDFAEEPRHILGLLASRLHSDTHGSTHFTNDLHFLQRLEVAFDRYVRRIDQELELENARSVPNHLKKRSTSSYAPYKPAFDDGSVHGRQTSSHLREFRPRSGGYSGNRPTGVWREPTLQELAASMGFGADDPTGEPVARFWRLRESIFRPAPGFEESVREPKSLYSPYQDAHPVRGADADTTYPAIFHDQVLGSAARNRFRDIDALLSYVLENAVPLGFDEILVAYLRAIKQRFDLYKQLSTPTDAEIVDRALDKIRAALGGPSEIQDTTASIVKRIKHAEVRSKLAENNVARDKLDSYLIGDLEHSLDSSDRVVPGAETHTATTKPLLRRNASQDVPADDLPQHAQGSDSLTSHPRVPATLSRSTPLTTTNNDLSEEDRPRGHAGPSEIERFLQRNEPLLPALGRATDRREYLIRLFRAYQDAVPLRGESLNLENAQLFTRLTMDNVGRDRFKHIGRIMEYMIVNREDLRLNRFRTRFLKAAAARFRKLERLLSPTLEDFREREQLAADYKDRGTLSGEQYQLVMRAINSGKALRSSRALVHGKVIEYDLNLIKRIEKELEEISSPIQQAEEVGSRLVRREARLQARMEGEKQPLPEDKRSEQRLLEPAEEPQPFAQPDQSSSRVVNERMPTDVEATRILSGLGMHLTDEHARPIAAWRLHEAGLLEGRTDSGVAAGRLRHEWSRYRQEFPEEAPFNYGNIVPMQVGINPYIDTDEGARFLRARKIMR